MAGVFVAVQVGTLSGKTGDGGAVVLVAVEMPTESADQRQETSRRLGRNT